MSFNMPPLMISHLNTSMAKWFFHLIPKRTTKKSSKKPFQRCLNAEQPLLTGTWQRRIFSERLRKGSWRGEWMIYSPPENERISPEDEEPFQKKISLNPQPSSFRSYVRLFSRGVFWKYQISFPKHTWHIHRFDDLQVSKTHKPTKECGNLALFLDVVPLVCCLFFWRSKGKIPEFYSVDLIHSLKVTSPPETRPLVV